MNEYKFARKNCTLYLTFQICFVVHITNSLFHKYIFLELSVTLQVSFPFHVMCHFGTNTEDWAALITRVTLGGVMLPHGLQKTLGMFGGNGFSATMEFMTGMGMPAVIVFLVIIGESLGALGLIFGFLTRFCAASFVIIMGGAAFMHAGNGFFMNWMGAQAGEGFEYHLLMIGMGLALAVSGGGKWAIDGLIKKH